MADKELLKGFEKDLLKVVDVLIDDLEISNPTYRMAFDVANNPVIEAMSMYFHMNPCYFALPIKEGAYVQFDLEKIKKQKAELEQVIRQH
jgi:hypothetical protein